MHARAVVFWLPKLGNAEHEWEDGCAVRLPRIAVADGATLGVGSSRWAEDLVTGFVGSDPVGDAAPPDLGRLDDWLGPVRDRWLARITARATTEVARIKLDQGGAFATFLGLEVGGLDGRRRPGWRAVAIGDTVLFHVRDRAVRSRFPDFARFGSNPDGLSTAAGSARGIGARLARAEGDLRPGDQLYVATDALAEWIVGQDERHSDLLWRTLARLDHPDTFAQLVADQRRVGALKNDDVTLVRVQLAAAQPEFMVVGL